MLQLEIYHIYVTGFQEGVKIFWGRVQHLNI